MISRPPISRSKQKRQAGAASRRQRKDQRIKHAGGVAAPSPTWRGIDRLGALLSGIVSLAALAVAVSSCVISGGQLRIMDKQLAHEVTDGAEADKRQLALISANQRLADAALASAATAKGQLTLSQAAQRAWLVVTPQIAGDLDWNPLGVWVPLNFTLRNVGGLPAHVVRLENWTVSPSDDLDAELTRRCRQLGPLKLPQFGKAVVLYPDQETADWNEQIAQGHPLPYADARKRATGGDGNGPFPIWTMGCVVYHYGDPKDLHRVGFIYQVSHLVQTQQGLAREVTFSSGNHTPKAELDLGRAWIASTLND